MSKSKTKRKKSKPEEKRPDVHLGHSKSQIYPRRQKPRVKKTEKEKGQTKAKTGAKTGHTPNPQSDSFVGLFSFPFLQFLAV